MFTHFSGEVQSEHRGQQLQFNTSLKSLPYPASMGCWRVLRPTYTAVISKQSIGTWAYLFRIEDTSKHNSSWVFLTIHSVTASFKGRSKLVADIVLFLYVAFCVVLLRCLVTATNKTPNKPALKIFYWFSGTGRLTIRYSQEQAESSPHNLSMYS